MARTTKARPAKTFKFGDGEMTGIDHLVYEDGKRVGTVQETRYSNGKVTFEAVRGKETLKNGNTIRRFPSVDAAAQAI